MKLFISWSGVRSRVLAEALREWLPLVLHYVKPWLSEADLVAGERWNHALARELEASNLGIICLTRENVSSPWVLFEAGSLAKSLEGSKVIPLLLDLELSEMGGPLSQFQAKKANKASMVEVVQSINNCAENPIPDTRLRNLFEALWVKLEKQIAAVPELELPDSQIRSQSEILEELVVTVRSWDSRISSMEVSIREGASASRSWRKIDQSLMGKFSDIVADNRRDPIFLLIAASMVREEVPWLYELGMEAYRAAKSGDIQETRSAILRFRRVTERLLRMSFVENLGFDAKAFHLMVAELQRWYLVGDDDSTEGVPAGRVPGIP